jgi:hypothetical protein
MPWRVTHNGGGCSGDKPWAVIKISDGSLVSCHETESKAKAQLRALYASEDHNTADPADSIVHRVRIRRHR